MTSMSDGGAARFLEAGGFFLLAVASSSSSSSSNETVMAYDKVLEVSIARCNSASISSSSSSLLSSMENTSDAGLGCAATLAGACCF